MSKHSIYDPIFCQGYLVCVGNFDELKDFYDKTFNKSIDEYYKDCYGAFIVEEQEGSNKDIGLIWWADNKLTTLVHECQHTTHWILNDVEVDISVDNDEMACYYQEFLIREVLKFMKEENKEICLG